MMRLRRARKSGGFPVSGSVALVTGAAGGMGEHLAKGLARRGAELILLDRDAEGLRRVSGEIAAAHPDITVSTHTVDLADRASADALIEGLVHERSRIDLLFNNAGVALGGVFAEVGEKDFDWLMEVNLHAPIRITRAVLPLMLANGRGHIVNTSSLFGILAPPGQIAYSTAKFGLRGFSEGLRHELAELGEPVGVTVVHPGGIKTGIATSARAAEGVDADLARQGRESFDKLLVYPADRAAEDIIEAAIAGTPRLLIGKDAIAGDALVRALPGRYWQLIRISLRKNLTLR